MPADTCIEKLEVKVIPELESLIRPCRFKTIVSAKCNGIIKTGIAVLIEYHPYAIKCQTFLSFKFILQPFGTIDKRRCGHAQAIDPKIDNS